MIRAWRYREGEESPDAVELDPFPEVVSDELLWIDCDQPTEAELETLGKQLQDRKSTRLNSSHIQKSRMPSSA